MPTAFYPKVKQFILCEDIDCTENYLLCVSFVG